MNGERGLSRFTPLISDAASIAGDADLQKVLRSLVTEAMSATGARYGALGIVGEHGVLSEFIYEGIDEKVAKEIGPLPTGHGVLGTVIRENAAITLDSIASHPDSVGFPANHPPMANFLGVPVAVGDEAFGRLYLTEKDGVFDEADVATVTALSKIAGSAVATARLQRRLRRVAVVEDRQRIARDLHDSVIQDLFAVGLSLQAIEGMVEDPDTSGLIEGAIDTLDDSVNTLRRYVFELRETSPTMTGLDERLQSVVARMGSAYPARVELAIAPIAEAEWHDDVVLLVTEAVSNALRHSGAELVSVEVDQTEHELTVRVSDEGVGFDPEDGKRGMGLANMKTRAESLAGELHVDSEQGRGTVITATIPLLPS